MSLRALFDSISGLQSHSTWLDVIGNNISNVNTVAYKSSRVEFADQFSQTLSTASGDEPGNNLGGINPQQVGLGTRVASIETLFDQGTSFVTGNNTDLSIAGDGFLVAKQGAFTYLTRAGNLSFDGLGYLVDQNGGRIQGINAMPQYDKKFIRTFINPFGIYPGSPDLYITDASLKMNTSNVNNMTSIQLNRDMVLPPKATTEVTFKGNLDSFQQANILDLFPGGPFGPGATLPIGFVIGAFGFPATNTIDTNRMDVQFTAGGGFTLQQRANLSTFTPGVFPPPAPLENAFLDLTTIKAAGGNYAWDQQPPISPAHEAKETVYDSLGNARELTIQFYQVNDMGTAVPPINTPPMCQVCYAWYAFDTTAGAPVSTQNLLGGTGIGEGDPFFYDRGVRFDRYIGDFIWFNTDGSLASSGGLGGFPGGPGNASNFMITPRIYIPGTNLPFPQAIASPIPTLGAEIMAVDLNFGTFGLLGQGRRDGLYSDAEGSYKLVNGVNTYLPNHTAYGASQDGYRDGILQGVNFNPDGTLVGSFSNGQNVNLAQVVMEQVQNPAGLNKVGSNYFTTSANSGTGHLGFAAHGSFGKIQGGTLEGSNVDLTVELSNMIVAQRGFEANARMISGVSKELETINQLGL